MTEEKLTEAVKEALKNLAKIMKTHGMKTITWHQWDADHRVEINGTCANSEDIKVTFKDDKVGLP